MKKKNKVTRKFKFKKFLLFMIFFLFLGTIFIKFITNKIKTITVEGNEMFTDQEIIELAKIQNYPSSLKNNFIVIEKRLEKNKYILAAQVSMSSIFGYVNIQIKENYPLFYYLPSDETILYDGSKVDDTFAVPTVINEIPSDIYNEFINQLTKIDKDILYRFSEIKYEPNDVDSERFIIYMNDKNIIYITIDELLKLNKYYDMINSFNGKRGIIHLDSGEYLEVMN